MVSLASFKRKRCDASSSDDDSAPTEPSVYGKITPHDEVEYGIVEVDRGSAPRLMRALIALMSELMDVASF